MKVIENGKNGLMCAYCGKVKEEVSFVIGACGKKPDWCMIYGTGKMACPECYEKASKEGSDAADNYVKKWNALAKKEQAQYAKCKGSTFGCPNCLWASIECKSGSKFKMPEGAGAGACANYTYYD